MKKVLSKKSIFKPAWLELTAEDKARISAEVDYKRHFVETKLTSPNYTPSQTEIDKATISHLEIQKLLDPYVKVSKLLKTENFRSALKDGWARNPNGPSAYENKLKQLDGKAMK